MRCRREANTRAFCAQTFRGSFRRSVARLQLPGSPAASSHTGLCHTHPRVERGREGTLTANRAGNASDVCSRSTQTRRRAARTKRTVRLGQHKGPRWGHHADICYTQSGGGQSASHSRVRGRQIVATRSRSEKKLNVTKINAPRAHFPPDHRRPLQRVHHCHARPPCETQGRRTGTLIAGARRSRKQNTRKRPWRKQRPVRSF